MLRFVNFLVVFFFEEFVRWHQEKNTTRDIFSFRFAFSLPDPAPAEDGQAFAVVLFLTQGISLPRAGYLCHSNHVLMAGVLLRTVGEGGASLQQGMRVLGGEEGRREAGSLYLGVLRHGECL